MDDYLNKPAPLSERKPVLEKRLPAVSPEPASTAAAGSSVAVDVKVLAELVGDEAETIREFLVDFRVSAAAIAQAIKTACENNLPSQASAEAHKLKSSAFVMGALALGELCALMETAGKEGDRETLAMLLPAFEQEMVRVIDFLDASLDETG